jgi:hypothetical protein
LRKPTNDCLTVPAEVPDADGELGAAAELEGKAEAALGSGAGDDADEEEKDEHPASNGNSAIEAATIVSHPLPGACRTPSMPYLYQERAIIQGRAASGCGAAGFVSPSAGASIKVTFFERRQIARQKIAPQLVQRRVRSQASSRGGL